MHLLVCLVNLRKGVGALLLKPNAKRRRTKYELTQAKVAAELQKDMNEDRDRRFEQLEELFEQKTQEAQKNAEAAACVGHLLASGAAIMDGQGNFSLTGAGAEQDAVAGMQKFKI